MKRLMLIAASLASLLAAAPLAGTAFAYGHGRGGDEHGDQGRGDHGRGNDRGPPQREDRGPPPRGYDRGPPPREDRGQSRDYDRAPPPDARRDDGRRDDGRRYDRRDFRDDRSRDDEDQRYDDRRGAYPPPPVRLDPTPRRGGYLPRGFSGPIVDDYQRFRLRPPPRGYAWVRLGGGFALVDMANGQIFDMVQ